MVLVIEDMHWADRSTRDLLAFLIRNQASLDGVLIVVTYRSDDLHRTHPLRPLLAELDRIDWVTRMDLARLTRQDTGQLVAQITGREPGEDLLTAVYRRAEGNPLFVEALIGNGESGPGLPESLHDLLMAAVSAAGGRDRRRWSGSPARAASGLQVRPSLPRSPGYRGCGWLSSGPPTPCPWPRTPSITMPCGRAPATPGRCWWPAPGRARPAPGRAR